jgi:hypothetical protein
LTRLNDVRHRPRFPGSRIALSPSESESLLMAVSLLHVEASRILGADAATGVLSIVDTLRSCKLRPHPRV